MTMVDRVEVMEKIRNTIVLNVSAKGEGLAVTIPAEIRETFNIQSGDLVEVSFGRHWKRKTET